MRNTLSILWTTRGFFLVGLGVLWASGARAQDTIQATANSANTWQRYDWLKPAEDQQRQAASGETFRTTTGQDIGDPFTVLTTGSLWQEKSNTIYTKRLNDVLQLSCESSCVVLDDDSEDLSRSQKVGLQLQPVQELTLRGDVHGSANDQPLPSASSSTSGAAFSAESHLPLNAVLTMGVNSDRTTTEVPSGLETQTNAYDVQVKQSLGKLPLSAVLKGHYEGTSIAGGALTSLPSLEQSLVWKPVETITLQAGLRQQQYQEYPGVDHQLNEALFADWSQKLVDNVSWHSYAEVLNSRGLVDQAPAAAIASGANGTPQATTPLSATSPTSSLPISIDDQTLTFSTGPSFQLQKDISASVEYSNRWDRDPAPGAIGQEQRVSVSVKGTF
jgi:hypothetical protein